MPSRYSPLQPNGNGIQSIYLTEISQTFAEAVAGLMGQEGQPFISAVEVAATAEDDRIKTGDDLDAIRFTWITAGRANQKGIVRGLHVTGSVL